MPMASRLPLLVTALLCAPAVSAYGQEEGDIFHLNQANADLGTAYVELVSGSFQDCAANPQLCTSVTRRLSDAADHIMRYFDAHIRRDASGTCLDGDPYRAYALAYHLRDLGLFMLERGSGNSYSGPFEHIDVHLRDYPHCDWSAAPKVQLPSPGDYACDGGWGAVEIISSGAGSASGTYTGTYESMPGWIRIDVAPDGQASGEWGEPKVTRTGYFENVKISADGFSAEWGVYPGRGGRTGDRELPESTGRISCTLK